MAAAAPQRLETVLDTLATATGLHVEEIIKAVKALPDKANTKATGMSAKTTNGVKKARSKKQRSKQEKTQKGPKRPLNSWMAYRKFYNQMLSPRTQKVKSKILTVLWKADPFEAKWSILAKAYSILRGDRDKEEVSLDKFLAFCAPRVGIIPADIYLGVMGWELSAVDEEDQTGTPSVTRVLTPDVDKFPVSLTTTTLSVEDLVERCVEAKLFGATDNNATFNDQAGSLAMAVQPWSPAVVATQDQPTTTSQLPLGVETLRAGTAELDLINTNSDIASFDPNSTFHNSWNPAEFDGRYEDGGVWDGFNLEDGMLADILGSQDVDFASFVNAEHIA